MSALVPVGAILGGVIFAFAAAGQWQTLLGFLAQVPFGTSDPSFGQDIAFYVWTLPLLLAARDWLVAMLLVASAATVLIYALGIRVIQPPDEFQVSASAFSNHPLSGSVVRQGSLLAAGGFVGLGFTYWLNNWLLVYSERGVVYGASATDVHGGISRQCPDGLPGDVGSTAPCGHRGACACTSPA
ncbi:MAG TPA: UPF0182 family protein [Chloroflexota bacterium]